MRTKVPYSPAKLTAAVAQAEKDGPLASLGELWEKASKIYNATNKADVSPARFYQLVREHDILCKTQPGKKGKGANSGVGILCGLTPWATYTTERGRGAGNQVTNRLVVACDKYNWIIGQQAEGADSLTGGMFYPSFRLLLKCMVDYCPGVNKAEAVQAINQALAEKLGMTPVAVDMGQSVTDIGLSFDNYYKVSIHRHGGAEVRKRLFGVAVEEEEVEAA
jgi:hypothetical protein